MNAWTTVNGHKALGYTSRRMCLRSLSKSMRSGRSPMSLTPDPAVALNIRWAELAFSTGPEGPRLPCSFVYGGRPSSPSSSATGSAPGQDEQVGQRHHEPPHADADRPGHRPGGPGGLHDLPGHGRRRLDPPLHQQGPEGHARPRTGEGGGCERSPVAARRTASCCTG